MAAKKKILFLVRQLGQGGTERRLIDIKEALSDEFEIEVHSITGTDLLNDKFNDYLKELRNEWPVQKRVRKLYSKLISFSPDLVHSFDLSSGLYYKLLSFGIPFKKPIFLSGTGSGMLNEKRLLVMLRKPMLQPDLYVCNSNAGKKFLSACIPSNQEIKVIENGLNTNRYSNVDKDKEMPAWASDTNPIIGYIGKLDNTKHGERILEVAKLLEEHPHGPKFVVFGDGPNRGMFEREVGKMPERLRNNIHYLGTVHNAARFIKYFSVGTLCSDSEGFPNSILEYMSIGIPWVSTNVGDIQNILAKGECGFVLKRWDPVHFAEKVRILLEDRSLRDRFGSTGRDVFRENYTIDISVTRYKELYSNLLSK